MQVAGQNSYTIANVTNTGLQSGLDKTWSNYVAGETLQPTSAPFTLGLKQQFNSDGGALARFDSILTGRWGGWEGTLDYAQYAAQPLLGWQFPRNGLITSAKYKFDNGVVVDRRGHARPVAPLLRSDYGSPFYPTQWNVGLAYTANSCVTVKVGLQFDLERADQHQPRRGRAAGDPRSDVHLRSRFAHARRRQRLDGGRMSDAPIALTMGDPAGVGPELALMAWREGGPLARRSS